MTERALEQRSDVWIWALALAATASVVVLAVVQGNRTHDLGAKASARFTLPMVGGGNTSIQNGKVTMVDFWATWCGPCRVSMPRVQKLWQEYRPSGVELFSVDTDDPSPDREPNVREFLQQNGLTFPVALDDGTAEQAFAVANLPTMLLLDREGRVVWSHVGALTASGEQDLRSALDRTLGR